MKKILSVLLVLAALLAMATSAALAAEIALVTDVGTIDDESFNQACWEGVKAYAEANGKTYTRTAKKGDSDAKVQAYDTQVELLWDAKQVTINFYRNAADGAEKVSTMTIRAGETIEGLPKLDGE